MKVDWGQFRQRTTFILGADKHAGKTTFLKYALGNLRAAGCAPAYMSIGIDGERQDLLSGQVKPTILAEAGDVVATTEAALYASDAGFEMLQVFPERSQLGRSLVARVRRAGLLELIGPLSNRLLGEIIAFVKEQTAAGAIVVDGAADRVTQVASTRRAGYVMVIRASASTLTSAADRIRLVSMLADLPGPSSEDGPKAFRLPGALTPDKLQTIPDGCQAMVLEDFTRVFVSYAQMSRLCRQCRVSFSRRFDMLFFVVNLFDVTAGEFAQLVGDGLMHRVVFNPYMEPSPC